MHYHRKRLRRSMFRDGFTFYLLAPSRHGSRQSDDIASTFAGQGSISVPRRLEHCWESLRVVMVREERWLSCERMGWRLEIESLILLLLRMDCSLSRLSLQATLMPRTLLRESTALRSFYCWQSAMNLRMWRWVDLLRCMLWSSVISTSVGLRRQRLASSLAWLQLTTVSLREYIINSLQSIRSMRARMSIWKGLTGWLVLKYCLRGSISSDSMNSGMNDDLEASSIAIFSKEQKGLSRMMQSTFRWGLLPWLRIRAADPIDLPHSTYFSQRKPPSSAARMAWTSSCSSSPQLVQSPSLRPLLEKSKEQTSQPCLRKDLAMLRASSLLEPRPCAQTMQVVACLAVSSMVSMFCLRVLSTLKMEQSTLGWVARYSSRQSWLQLYLRVLVMSSAKLRASDYMQLIQIQQPLVRCGNPGYSRQTRLIVRSVVVRPWQSERVLG